MFVSKVKLIKISFIYLLFAALSAVLSGCGGGGVDDLRLWMAEQKKTLNPRVEPVAASVGFVPARYDSLGVVEVFNPLRLLNVLRREAPPTNPNEARARSEQSRRKEVLEMYPLDTMQFLGFMKKEGAPRDTAPVALLRVGGALHQVAVGARIGQNYGKVTHISETAVQIKELAQDAAGDWLERVSKIEISAR